MLLTSEIKYFISQLFQSPCPFQARKNADSDCSVSAFFSQNHPFGVSLASTVGLGTFVSSGESVGFPASSLSFRFSDSSEMGSTYQPFNSNSILYLFLVFRVALNFYSLSTDGSLIEALDFKSSKSTYESVSTISFNSKFPSSNSDIGTANSYQI